MTPPWDVACTEGPNGHCQANRSIVQTGNYSAEAWRLNPIWSRICFEIDDPHDHHYNLIIHSGENLNMTAQAFGERENGASSFELTGSCVAGDLVDETLSVVHD